METAEEIKPPFYPYSDFRWSSLRNPVEFTLKSGETVVVQCPKCGGGRGAPREFVKWRQLPSEK